MKAVVKGSDWRIVKYTNNKDTYFHFYGSMVKRVKELANLNKLAIFNKHTENGVEYVQVKLSSINHQDTIDILNSLDFQAV